MPIEFVRNDITKMTCDAIVNAANSSLLGGGGVDGAIHRAAGRELYAECKQLGGCKTGEAKITKGYKLPSKYIIHTVGPVWRGGNNGEREKLVSCYQNSLKLAVEHGCETVAFPLISSGIYGYPKEEALGVAVDTCAEFLAENGSEMTVYIVIFDKKALDIGQKQFKDIKSFIDENYVEEAQKRDVSRSVRLENELREDEFFESPKSEAPSAHFPKSEAPSKHTKKLKAPSVFTKKSKTPSENISNFDDESDELGETFFEAPSVFVPENTTAVSQQINSLEEALNNLDESFSEMLLRLIDERGLSDPQVYKKANIDRKLFSKIRGDKNYRPKKTTAVAFAVALELDLSETRELLGAAGFALSRSSKFDVIIEYFITKKSYDIYEINEALFTFDQVLLC